MVRQIRALDVVGGAELGELHGFFVDGGGDVAHARAGDGGRDVAGLLAGFGAVGVVAREGVGAAEVEGAAFARQGAVGYFLGRRGTVGAHLAGGDAHGLVAEHEAGEEVDDAEDDDDDAAGDDNLPGGGAEGFLRRGFFVEVAQDGDAEDDHKGAEGDEAGGRGEEGPVPGDVGAEEGEFGEHESDWRKPC